jgi:hypothetical protein
MGDRASDADELGSIADQISSLKDQFVKSRDGLFLPAAEQSRFVALATEAKSILVTGLGPGNDFVMQLIYTVNSGSGGFFGGPSWACVTETEELLRAAIRQMARSARRKPPDFANAATKSPYVDPIRLTEIQRLARRSDLPWDFNKLAGLCGELNIAHENDCHYATAMLVRSIADHVPPVFGVTTFSQVSASSTSGRSFKDSMEQLDKFLRKIADGYLHQHIRKAESVPTGTQVDFRQSLDQLLGEVVRLSR